MLSFIWEGAVGDILAPLPSVQERVIGGLGQDGEKAELAVIQVLMEAFEEEQAFDVNAPLSEISAPVHLAAYYGRSLVVGFLAQKNADINLRGPRGNTALHFAAHQGKLASVKKLLELGADPSIKNSYGLLAVQLSQHVEATTLLNIALPPKLSPQKKEADKSSGPVVRQEQHTPITGTTTQNRFKGPGPEADVLTMSSIPISSPGVDMAKPTVSLARSVLQAAMETSATMGSPAAKLTPIEKVFRWSIEIKQASFERLEKYVSSHPDIVHARYVGLISTIPKSYTLLHSAASCGNTKVVRFLLGAGADAMATDCFGQSALHMAAENGHLDAVILLKEAVQKRIKANPVGVNAPVDLSGCTPLGSETRKLKQRMTAEKSKDFDMVREKLFEAGDASIFPEVAEDLRSGVQGNLAFGYADMVGWRGSMEDAICVQSPLPDAVLAAASGSDPSATHSHGSGVYAVFDGHGGAFCSTWASENLLMVMNDVSLKTNAAVRDQETKSWGLVEWEDFLNVVCAELDSRLLGTKDMQVKASIKKTSGKSSGFGSDSHETNSISFKASDTSGSCCVLALVTSTHVFVANLGDCRCIVAAADHSPELGLKVTPLSHDHAVANNAEERLRLKAKGGTVVKVTSDEIVVDDTAGTHVQVDRQTVAVSRGFGDFHFKVDRIRSSVESVSMFAPADQVISCVPEVQVWERTNQDRFLLLACDGVYDVMTNEACVEVISQELGPDCASWSPGSIARSCDKLLKECLKRKSTDNMSALIVHLGTPSPRSSLHSVQQPLQQQAVSDPVPPVLSKILEYDSQVATPSKIEDISNALSKVDISEVRLAQPEFSHMKKSSSEGRTPSPTIRGDSKMETHATPQQPSNFDQPLSMESPLSEDDGLFGGL